MMMQQPPAFLSWMYQQPPAEEEVRMIWIGDLQQWMDKVEDEQVRTLRIGNLEHWMDESYIDSCFSHTGEVFTIKVFRKYGFIEFKSRVIAEKILHKFNGTEVLPFSLNSIIPTTTTATNKKKKNQKKTRRRGRTGGGGGGGGTYIPPTSIKISQKTGCTNFNADKLNNNSTWEDMLKWWSLSQLDGTCTTRTVHAANRVYEIAAFFQIPFYKWKDEHHELHNPTEVKKVEALLDELSQYVDSIDIAKEFHSMGALKNLLGYLTIKYGGIPAKVVKVVSTMVQSNPNSKQIVMEADGDGHLFFALFSFDDPTLETNVLDAISLLFQDNTPGITAFRQRNGYASMIYHLNTFCEHTQRKAVKLIYCLLCQHSSDCNIVTRLGYHRIMIKMASSYYAEVREAALRCLLLLSRFKGDGNSCRLVKNSKQLKQALPKLVERFCAMAPKHRGAKGVESRLLSELWIACYTEPCSLLSGLHGEDAPACDVGDGNYVG